MNLKAKNEWRRSGERAGASTGPARATGLATHLLLLSSSCHPVATLLRPPFSSENPHTPAQVLERFLGPWPPAHRQAAELHGPWQLQ